MPTKSGLPGWFPEDFSADPELLEALEDAGAWHAAGRKKTTGLATELASWEHELRGPHGMWTREGDTVHYHGSLGLPREKVPQFSGTIGGEYQPPSKIIPQFNDWLKARGIGVTRERVDASSLRPVKATGSYQTVRGLADEVKSGKRDPDWKPIYVSSDGYVLDGTQTWAAKALADSEGGPKPGIAVDRASVPLDQLMPLAAQFMGEIGMPYRKAGEIADPKYRKQAGLSTELASIDGHHVPGTPFTFRHGWQPIVQSGGRGTPSDSMALFRHPDGSWDPARQALHEQIINGALAGHTREAHPVATFLGGGTAAGKSTRWPKGSIPGVHIDSDELKAQLPEWDQMKAEGDTRAAQYLHEESSYLSKRIKAESEKRGYSYTLDGTGDASYEKMKAKIDAARAAGHQVNGKYMTLDTEEAIRRAKIRAEQTNRDVQPSVIRELHAGVSNVFAQLAANNDFDSLQLYDNNGGPPPTEVGHKDVGGSWTVTDPAAWRQFLAKAGE